MFLGYPTQYTQTSYPYLQITGWAQVILWGHGLFCHPKYRSIFFVDRKLSKTNFIIQAKNIKAIFVNHNKYKGTRVFGENGFIYHCVSKCFSKYLSIPVNAQFPQWFGVLQSFCAIPLYNGKYNVSLQWCVSRLVDGP